MNRRFCTICIAFTVWWIAPALGRSPVPAATSADTVTPVSWSLLFEAAAGGAHDSLATLGVRTDAHPEYDSQYDLPSPPAPPGAFIRVYFPHDGAGWPALLGERFVADFTSPTAPEWRMIVETNAGPGSVTLEWDTSEVAPLPGSYYLMMVDSAADSLIMIRETGSYTFTYGSPRVFLISAEFAATFIDIGAGWNIVSVPRFVADSSVGALFPGVISQAFGFDSAYRAVDPLSVGPGYWLKSPAPTIASITGLSADELGIPVRAGWNMIGALSVAIPPPRPPTVVSPFYEYSGGYHTADSLVPGKGYWVKVSADGILPLGPGGNEGSAGLPGGFAVQDPPDATSGVQASITLLSPGEGKATLRLIGAGAARDPGTYDLPPVPPAGAFDARFSGRGGAALLPPGDGEEGETPREYTITVQSVNPTMTIKADPGSSGVTIFAETGPDQWRAITGISEPVALTRDPGRTALRIRASGGAAPPAEFRLGGNYPNPFNPATRIRYSLPAPSDVTVIVTDALGRTVLRTSPVRQEAGPREYVFDAGSANLPSGVYFYSVSAEAAGTGARSGGSGKMLLLK